MPHERIQEYTSIDYTKEMVILAITKTDKKEEVLGLGQYSIYEQSLTAEVAFLVRDKWQNIGIGMELLSYLTYLAKKDGLSGFTAEVLRENTHMLHLFESMGFDIDKQSDSGMLELKMTFKDIEDKR